MVNLQAGDPAVELVLRRNLSAVLANMQFSRPGVDRERTRPLPCLDAILVQATGPTIVNPNQVGPPSCRNLAAVAVLAAHVPTPLAADLLQEPARLLPDAATGQHGGGTQLIDPDPAFQG